MKTIVSFILLFFFTIFSACGGYMDNVSQCEFAEVFDTLPFKGKYATSLVEMIDLFNKDKDISKFNIFLEENSDDTLNITFVPQLEAKMDVFEENGMNQNEQYCNRAEFSKVYIKGKYAISLVGAINAFNITSQNIRNFYIYIHCHEEKKDDVVKIEFFPKRTPGERGLGGRTSYGQGIIYDINIHTGIIIKKSFLR